MSGGCGVWLQKVQPGNAQSKPDWSYKQAPSLIKDLIKSLIKEWSGSTQGPGNILEEG